MNFRKGCFGLFSALAFGLLACGTVSANPVNMDFDGLTPGTKVHNYYAGGCTTRNILFQRSCGGPDYGVKWKNAHVRWIFDAASAPNWAGPGLFSDGTITMNVAGGFDTGLYFDYSTFLKTLSGTVTVFAGRNGHGSELGHLNLPGTGLFCNGDAPCWLQAGLGFDGTAKSVIFDGFGAALGLDDVTIGARLKVPEPATIGMFGLGLLMLGLLLGRRRRSA